MKGVNRGLQPLPAVDETLIADIRINVNTFFKNIFTAWIQSRHRGAPMHNAAGLYNRYNRILSNRYKIFKPIEFEITLAFFKSDILKWIELSPFFNFAINFYNV